MILLNVVGMIPIISRATDLNKMKFKVAMVGIGNLYGVRISAQVSPCHLSAIISDCMRAAAFE